MERVRCQQLSDSPEAPGAGALAHSAGRPANRREVEGPFSWEDVF